MSTKIEWCDETWNPVIGCTKISPGCDNCYAERMAARQCYLRPGCEYEQVVARPILGPRDSWNGKTAFVTKMYDRPEHWRKPRRIFVSSMGDLFHENTPGEAIDAVIGQIEYCGWHTFLILTKRGNRMRQYCAGLRPIHKWGYPLPNLWLGATIEDANQLHRWDHLRQTPAAVRFISVEPMLGPMPDDMDLTGIDWVICGGESGPGARAMQPDWVRGLRDQCVAANVPFFFKQWGTAHTPGQRAAGRDDSKPKGGATLDGREWKESPNTEATK